MTQVSTYVDFPYHFAADGMTARTTRVDRVRDLIEQLLFTRPGERLMRPAFGCGLANMLFAPLGTEQAAAARMTIQLAVQEYMSREIEVVALDVRAEESALLIDITYRLRTTGEVAAAHLVAEVSA